MYFRASLVAALAGLVSISASNLRPDSARELQGPPPEESDDAPAAKSVTSNYDGNYSEVLALAKRVPTQEEVDANNKLVNEVRTKYVQGWPVPVQEIFKKLQLPPDTYPEQLQGIYWMDIRGQYGVSQVPPTAFAAEGLFTFGNTNFASYDPALNHLLAPSYCGGQWVVLDDESGREKIQQRCLDPISGPFAYLRRFVFSEDFETAFIDQWYGPGNFSTYISNDYTPVMYHNHPPEGACPPATNATKEEVSLCATWIRRSYSTGGLGPNATSVLMPDAVSGGSANYPVFQVVTQDGLPREPYFSAFVNAMLERNITDGLLGIYQDINDS